MTRILDLLVLWYLKKTNKCFMTRGKYGWKVAIDFHLDSVARIEKFTVELANSKRINY